MKSKIVLGLSIGLLMSVSAQAKVTDITTKSGTLGAPAAGQGQVVFFRPGSMMGAALGCTVHGAAGQLAGFAANLVARTGAVVGPVLWLAVVLRRIRPGRRLPFLVLGALLFVPWPTVVRLL